MDDALLYVTQVAPYGIDPVTGAPSGSRALTASCSSRRRP